MYLVELASRARRELKRLSVRDRTRITTRLSDLAAEPRPRSSVKLTGPLYRLRIGPLRVIYSVSDREELVVVLKIAKREKDTYERLEELF